MNSSGIHIGRSSIASRALLASVRSCLPSDASPVAPALVAALLLAANPFLVALGLPHPTAADGLDATGAGKSRAYELCAQLLAMLPRLLRPPGRPTAPPRAPSDTGAVTLEAYAFLRAHPGASISNATRYTYSDGFRQFILDLAERHADLDRGLFAAAVGVPLDTLKDWLDRPLPPAQLAPSAPTKDDALTNAQIASVAAAWRWDGPFSVFCAFVRADLAIAFGPTLIGRILSVETRRRRARRWRREPRGPSGVAQERARGRRAEPWARQVEHGDFDLKSHVCGPGGACGRGGNGSTMAGCSCRPPVHAPYPQILVDPKKPIIERDR